MTTRISEALAGINTKDEIESLAGSILKMETDINEYIENLTKVTAEKERIGAELDVARPHSSPRCCLAYFLHFLKEMNLKSMQP